MKTAYALPLVYLLLAGSALAVEPGSPGDVLQKVSEHYKKLNAYEIIAEKRITVSQAGQSGSEEEKVTLAVGAQGMFRVERDSGDVVEIRVADGKITWKAMPKQKLWAKMEAAQAVNVANDDEDADQSTGPTLGDDLFSMTQRSFVTRYTGLARYANVAVMQKADKLKFNGSKVECYVVQISTPASSNRLYVAKDSFLVLRHVELQTFKNGQAQITTEYKQISEGAPSPELFEYQPVAGSREVADILLPSERNLSLVGRQASDFTLKTVDGSPVHLADLRGKIILLDFWATWCPPCRRELPTIEALSRKYKDRNVLVFGVNDEDVATAKHFLEKNHPDLATLHDGGGKVNKMYGTHAIPTVLVIDPTGKIVAHFVGERSENELVAALKQAGMN